MIRTTVGQAVGLQESLPDHSATTYCTDTRAIDLYLLYLTVCSSDIYCTTLGSALQSNVSIARPLVLYYNFARLFGVHYNHFVSPYGHGQLVKMLIMAFKVAMLCWPVFISPLRLV